MPVERVFAEDYDYFPTAADLARGYTAYAEKLKIVRITTNLLNLRLLMQVEYLALNRLEESFLR